MHMAWFDVKFPPGLRQENKKVTRLQTDYERQISRVQNFTTQKSISSQISFSTDFSQFQGIAAMIDIVKPLTGDPQEAWTQQVAMWRIVSDVSSSGCVINLRITKRQDLSTSGKKRVQPIFSNLQPIKSKNRNTLTQLHTTILMIISSSTLKCYLRSGK